MRSQLHRFLLTLLVLALPLQTFASASLLNCGCKASLQPAAERMAMPDEMMAACHTHEPSGTPLSQHGCAHCAVCALAAALPVRVVDSPAIVPICRGFAPPSAELFSGHIPDGPERPPQAILA